MDLTTIGLVDDEKLMRDGLRSILETEPDFSVVGEAADGSEAVALITSHEPDVVLMDLRMPGRDGIWATHQIAAGGHATRVVVLTTFDQDDNVINALRAGASGYLLKSAPADKIVTAIRQAAAGEMTLAPQILESVVALAAGQINLRTKAAAVTSRLTDRELEVLRLMARGASNEEIGRALFIAEGTVKTHVGRVLSKLNARDRVQAVILAYESGTVKPGDR